MTRTKPVATACQLRSCFTLVEILIVIAIMGILMFIGLPAFEKLVKGSGVELASRNVGSYLGIARSTAITTRQYVAVLMPTATLPNNYRYSACKLCVVNSTPTVSGNVTTYTFKRWLASEQWLFLPVGTAIIDVNNTIGLEAADTHEEVNDVNFKDVGSTYTNVDNVRAIVFRSSGKPAGSGSRYVTVGESTFNGSTLIHTGTANRLDVKVDQFTGKTTILVNGVE